MKQNNKKNKEMNRRIEYKRPRNKYLWGRELEYIMPTQSFRSLAAEAPKGVDAAQWVIEYINATYGFLGVVTSIVLEDVTVEVREYAWE